MIFILDLYYSCRYKLWSVGFACPSQALPGTRSAHSQKEREDISSTVLPLFYQGPCHPHFAKSGKLLTQALSKAMILYLRSTVDPHLLFVDSYSLKEVRREMSSASQNTPWRVGQRWKDRGPQLTSIHYFGLQHAMQPANSSETWWPGYKMKTILPSSMCFLPLFHEAHMPLLSAHLLPQSVALLEQWVRIPLRGPSYFKLYLPQICPGVLVPVLGFSDKWWVKPSFRLEPQLWTPVLVL